MDRRNFLKTLGTGVVATTLTQWLTDYAQAQTTTAATAPATAAAPKPNIIFILSDDVGLGDIGCYGGSFKTPNIDALAATGTRFERCYSTPLCGPSRCQILTGQYPFRTGLINNESANAISPKKQIMLPTYMKQAGYVTASVGKWGQMSLGPGAWGFDEFLVFQGSGKYYANQGPYRVNGQSKALADNEYLPDVMHTFAVDFIQRHKDNAKPFFLYYPMSHIHGPILKTPDSQPGSNLYADNIAYMDKLVGKLVAELDRLKLRENTLILFSGDNGTAGNPNRSPVNGKPLSGAKGSMREGGSRVPLIANWTGKTPAGKVIPDLVDFSDFVPTFASLAAAPLPKDRPLDGTSFAPRLLDQPPAPREWVYVELDGRRYVRHDRFKLTGANELYDLKDAPFTETLLPADSPDLAATAARKRLHEVLTALVGADQLTDPPGLNKPNKNRPGKNKQP